LSCAQIITHNDQIQKYIETDIELAEALKLHVTILTQNICLDITPAETDSVPTTNDI